MFAILRALAPAILLLASASGPSATGVVLAHVATDHAVMTSHTDHHDAEHHTGTHGEPRDADHGPAHTHQVVPATTAAPARITGLSIDVQPCLPVLAPGRLGLPESRALDSPARPVPRAGPPEPQRHSILLI